MDGFLSETFELYKDMKGAQDPSFDTKNTANIVKQLTYLPEDHVSVFKTSRSSW